VEIPTGKPTVKAPVASLGAVQAIAM